LIENKTELENLEEKLMFLERRRYSSLSEKERDEGYNDNAMVNFGIICARHSIETHDWRFLNLSLKIRDSENILIDKLNLEIEIASAIKVVKNSFL